MKLKKSKYHHTIKNKLEMENLRIVEQKNLIKNHKICQEKIWKKVYYSKEWKRISNLK